MDWHKLLFLISIEFLESTNGQTWTTWVALEQPKIKYIITEDEFINAKLMYSLLQKKKTHQLVEMSVRRNTLTVIWNWSLLYANKLDLKTAYERFLTFSERHEFKSVLNVPDYAKRLRMGFEYVYSYVASLQLSDDDIYSPTNTKVSFVKSWIANIMDGTPNLTLERAYDLFIEKTYLVDPVWGVDSYFKSCFLDVEQTYDAL